MLDQPEVFGATGETWTWRGAIVDPGKPVRIVMAYTDAAAAIGVSPQVSSLNLAVQVNATTYLGNRFFGQWSVIGGSANYHDAVFLPAGASGALQMTVAAANIAGSGIPNNAGPTDQDCALVCYNCAQNPGCILTAAPASQNICAPADAVYTITVGSILGYNDPLTLSASGRPAGTTASFSPNPVTPAAAP